MPERNYNVYIDAMRKSLNEKLFFLERLDLNDFDTIIDFGCGEGNILKACHEENPNCRLIGVDKDVVMRELTKRIVPSCETHIALEKEWINEKTLIIFSSVLHEVGDYWQTIKERIKGTGCTLAIRDMRYTGEKETKAPITYTIMAIILPACLNPKCEIAKKLCSYIPKYQMHDMKSIYHFLLKYPYDQNWELELNEDYFSFDYDDLFTMGKVIYERNYTPSFIYERVIKDFGISMDNNTHTQIIFKVNKRRRKSGV